MKLEVEITKTRFYILLGVLVVLLGAVFVVGYNDPPGAGDPAVAGHSIDELNLQTAKLGAKDDGAGGFNNRYALFGHHLHVNETSFAAASFGSSGKYDTILNADENIFFRIGAGTSLGDTTMIVGNNQVEVRGDRNLSFTVGGEGKIKYTPGLVAGGGVDSDQSCAGAWGEAVCGGTDVVCPNGTNKQNVGRDGIAHFHICVTTSTYDWTE